MSDVTTGLLTPTCRCGSVKQPVRAGSSIGFCPNCDRCQATEYSDGEKAGCRKPTQADRRYHLAWERLKRQIYTRQP